MNKYVTQIIICFSILVLGGIFILHTPETSAQFETTPTTDTIFIRQSPLFPSPGESIDISIVSRVINTNDKQITWEQDGRVIASGIGENDTTITVGDSGETTTVTFKMVMDGEVFELSKDIEVVDVQLVWESISSYTPPFYKGKALHPGWGPVQVTALPDVHREDGSRYNESQLLYTWKYNGLVHGSDSGRGKQSFTVNAVPRRGNTVTVEIKTPEGNRVASESMTFPISQPEVLIYENDPLLGTKFQQEISGDLNLDDEQIRLTAMPFFFLSDSDTASQLEYNWTMNGRAVSPSERDNILTLRRQENARGEARVNVEIDDVSRIFPKQNNRVIIEF